MARWEAQIWRVHEYRGHELVSAHSANEEEHALEAAGRYAESYQAKGYELTPEELPDGTRLLRATKGDETLIIQVETREQ